MTAAEPICGVYIQKNMQRRRIPFRESLLHFTTQTRHGTTAPLLDIQSDRAQCNAICLQNLYVIGPGLACKRLSLGRTCLEHFSGWFSLLITAYKAPVQQKMQIFKVYDGAITTQTSALCRREACTAGGVFFCIHGAARCDEFAAAQATEKRSAEALTVWLKECVETK